MVRNFIKTYGWLFLGLILFAILASRISWSETWQALRQLTWGAIGILIVANIAALLPMFGRWWVILRAQGYAVPFWAIARYSLGGFAISYITPGPQFGGEPYQVIQLNRKHEVPLSQAAASVTIEKMLMLLTNLLFLIPGFVLLLQSQLFETDSLAVGIVPGLFGVSLLATLLGGWILDYRPLTWLSQRLPERMRGAIIETEKEIAAFCHAQPKALAWASLYSALNWVLLAFEYFLMARFLGILISPVEGLIMLTVFRLALLMPIPAGLGAVEGGHVWILGLLGIPMAAELALSLSLLIRLRDIIITLVGLSFAGPRNETRIAKTRG